MIKIYKSDYDEMAYCSFHKEYILDEKHYCISNEDETVVLMCESCYKKLINLKEIIEYNDDYEEMTIEL